MTNKYVGNGDKVNTNPNYSRNKNAKNINNKMVNKIPADKKIDLTKIVHYIQHLLLAIILLVTFYPPFLRGLYFRNELYPTEIIVFVAYLIFQGIKLFKRDKQSIKTPLDYISLAFVLIYAISLMNAASIHIAIEEWLKYCMYFAVFTMITDLAKEIRNSLYIMWTIVASAVIVSLVGIDAAANNIIAKIFNETMKSLNIDYELFDTMQGLRISSTLQYANALAAYLMAVFFVVMTLIMLSKKHLGRVTAAISGFILLTVFLLTQSRGAYIILPIALIIFIVLLPKNRIISAVAYIIGIIIPTVIGTVILIKYMPEPQKNAPKIWLVLLLGSIASGILVFMINKILKWLESINWKVYTLILGFVTVIAISFTFYLVKATEPIKLSHSDSQSDSVISATKNTVLTPNKTYKLKYEVEAKADKSKPYAYTINIYSRTENEIMFDGQTLIGTSTQNGTKGIETRELSFTTPNDIKAIRISFVNFYKSTSATFHSAYIADTSNGNIVKRFSMKYKYLPEMITSRLEGTMIDKSSLQRSFYTKDGIEIFKDNWLIGAGGGTWAKLYTGYQSFIYNSAQAHNYFLQVVLETGIQGILVLLGLFIALVFMIFSSKKRNTSNENINQHTIQAALFAGIVALLMHSAVDFDLSLSAVALLLWIITAIFNANYMSIVPNNRSLIKEIQAKPVIILALTLVLLIFPCIFSLALSYGVKSSKAVNNKDYTSGLKYSLKAESIDPWMPQYKIESANLIYSFANASLEDKKIAEDMMVKAELLSKYESKLLPNIGTFYLMTGKVEEGIKLFDRYVTLVPLAPETWEQRVNAYYSVLLKYAEAGKQDKIDEYIDRILVFNDEAQKVNMKNLNPFVFTERTIQALERVQYVKDFWQVKNHINMDKVVLYESRSMDINSDNMPDGWTFTKDYAKSRKISLLPGKKYKIELKLANNNVAPSVQFTINGAVDKKTALTLKDNTYSVEITVPPAFKPGNNVLTIFMPNIDTDAISKLIIEEE